MAKATMVMVEGLLSCVLRRMQGDNAPPAVVVMAVDEPDQAPPPLRAEDFSSSKQHLEYRRLLREVRMLEKRVLRWSRLRDEAKPVGSAHWAQCSRRLLMAEDRLRDAQQRFNACEERCTAERLERLFERTLDNEVELEMAVAERDEMLEKLCSATNRYLQTTYLQKLVGLNRRVVRLGGRAKYL